GYTERECDPAEYAKPGRSAACAPTGEQPRDEAGNHAGCDSEEERCARCRAQASHVKRSRIALSWLSARIRDRTMERVLTPTAVARDTRSQWCSSGEKTFEVVVADLPAALLALEAPFGGDRAVRHQHGSPAVALGKLELDQLLLVGLVVPDPGE